jgi:hypothetical protein
MHPGTIACNSSGAYLGLVMSAITKWGQTGKQSDGLSKIPHLRLIEIGDHRNKAAVPELFPKAFQDGDSTLGEPTKQ